MDTRSERKDRMSKNQYTMLDTPLSLAVSDIISLIEEKKEFNKRWDTAVNKVKNQMQEKNKPEIKHCKGYTFALDHKLPETKLKIKQPKQLAGMSDK